MSQPPIDTLNITRIFQATAIITGAATIFNLIFSAWILAGFFGVVSIATGAMALVKMKQSKHQPEGGGTVR